MTLWSYRAAPARGNGAEYLLLICCSGRGHRGVAFSQFFVRHQVGTGHLDFVAPPADDAPFSFHHRFETVLGNVRWVVLLLRTHFRIEEVSTPEEFGFGGARHQTCHRNAR